MENKEKTQMNMIESMTGAADAQGEIVEERYEKSGAFIGGLAGVVAGGVAGLVLGGITGAVTSGDGALSGALRGTMTGVLSGIAIGGISGALIERRPKEKMVYQLTGNKIQLEEDAGRTLHDRAVDAGGDAGAGRVAVLQGRG